MRTSLSEYCPEHDRQDLLLQWHPMKNTPLTPETVTYGSRRRVWWRCEHGHEWQAPVYARTAGTGCPVCAGKRPCPGTNDLASRYPDLAAEWHPAKNGMLTPADVTPGSHRPVWWVCEKGHEWRAMVKTRASGSGCPVCANRTLAPGENDLAAAHPELACQWHPTKNGALTPDAVLAGSWQKVWWRCEKGHQWQAAVASRVSGAGCPVCAGKQVIPGENDLSAAFPAVAAQWHPTRNGILGPGNVSPCSNKKVWWLCPLGHSYTATVKARTLDASGCPYCANRKVLPGFNDLATLEPETARQWNSVLNGALTPEMVVPGSHRKVWWECSDGHVWKAVISSRTGPKRCGCPVCAGKVKPERAERYRLAMEAPEASPAYRGDAGTAGGPGGTERAD